ncbi:unnamed protein product [Didymodactylos carnosus]|uniref:Uncharacterized protein n=1 Tax=Didymodactylos carnosus TaxID=1234261 RepID=A0A814SJA2_9BILA|nr:unnamed protein product [Didymodactylos carnosus]CAF3911653.1 unnamed protein product [Didymodactylos carnosus]
MNFIHTHFFSPSPLTHIDRVCDDYQRQVQDKAWQLQNDIREWRENTVKQINQHTDVQIRLLETWKYNTLRRIQEEKSVYSDWIIVYSEKKDDNEVKNIIRLYESLKYKLEELTYDMKPSVFFPYAPSSEQQQQQQQQSQATKQTDQLYNSTHKTGQQLSTRTSNDISNSRQSLTPSTTTTTTDETSNTKSRFNQESDFINQKQRTLVLL